MAFGDLLNAITILRNRKGLIPEKETKADLYFRRSLGMFPMHFTYYYYAQFLEDASPHMALENYRLSLEHIDSTKESLSYVDGLLAVGKMESELQHFDNSIKTFENAIDFLDNDTHLPADERARKLITALVNHGHSCSSVFKKDEAKASFLLALEKLNVDQAFEEVNREKSIIAVYTGLGDLETGLQDFEAANEYYETAMNRFEGLNKELQSAMTGLLINMSLNIGNFCLQTKQYNRAEIFILKGYNALLAADEMGPVEKNYQLCHAKHCLANLYFETHKNKKAEKEFLKALAISRKFADMNIIKFVPLYTGLLLDLANQTQFLNRRNEAEGYYTEAMEMIVKNLDSGRVDLYSQLVSLTIGYTDLLISNGDYNTASDYLLGTLEFLNGITTENSYFFRFDLANILERISKFLVIVDKRKDAEEMYTRACKEYEFLTSSPSVRFLTSYIDTLIDKAEFHAADQDYEKGINDLKRARELNETLKNNNKDSYQNFCFKIGASEVVLQMACAKLDDARETLKSLAKPLKKLVNRANYDDYEAKVARYWARVYEYDLQYEKAIESHHKCLIIYQKSAKNNTTIYVKPMIQIYCELAGIYEIRKEIEKVTESYHNAIKLFVENGWILISDWETLCNIFGKLTRFEYERENLPAFLNYFLKQRAMIITFSRDKEEIEYSNKMLANLLEEFVIDDKLLEEQMNKNELFFKALISFGHSQKRYSA